MRREVRGGGPQGTPGHRPPRWPSAERSRGAGRRAACLTRIGFTFRRKPSGLAVGAHRVSRPWARRLFPRGAEEAVSPWDHVGRRWRSWDLASDASGLRSLGALDPSALPSGLCLCLCAWGGSGRYERPAHSEGLPRSPRGRTRSRAAPPASHTSTPASLLVLVFKLLFLPDA